MLTTTRSLASKAVTLILCRTLYCRMALATMATESMSFDEAHQCKFVPIQSMDGKHARIAVVWNALKAWNGKSAVDNPRRSALSYLRGHATFDKALVNMQSIIHGYSLRIVLESTILLHTFHATRPRRRDALFFTHHVTHFLHLSFTAMGAFWQTVQGLCSCHTCECRRNDGKRAIWP